MVVIMFIRLFTLCDGAYNYNGKLTVVGTVDNIKVAKIPSSVTIGIAVKLSFTPQEYGEKRVSLHIVDLDGVDVIPPTILPTTDSRSKNGEEARLVIAGNFNNVIFNKEGSYEVKLYVNDCKFILPFRVLT